MIEFPQAVPVLTTNRLILTDIDGVDAGDLFAIYGDPEVMRYTDDAPFADLRTVEAMLASVGRLFEQRRSIEWAVTNKSDARLLGICGLHGLDEVRGTALAGCLLRRSAWGRGYMKEALTCLIQFAAHSLGLQRLRADIHPKNTRSLGLFATLGFVQIPNSLFELDISGCTETAIQKE